MSGINKTWLINCIDGPTEAFVTMSGGTTTSGWYQPMTWLILWRLSSQPAGVTPAEMRTPTLRGPVTILLLRTLVGSMIAKQWVLTSKFVLTDTFRQLQAEQKELWQLCTITSTQIVYVCVCVCVCVCLCVCERRRCWRSDSIVPLPRGLEN